MNRQKGISFYSLTAVLIGWLLGLSQGIFFMGLSLAKDNTYALILSFILMIIFFVLFILILYSDEQIENSRRKENDRR